MNPREKSGTKFSSGKGRLKIGSNLCESLRIRMKCFRECNGLQNTSKSINFGLGNTHKKIKLICNVYPNGMDQDSEGWVVVLPAVIYLDCRKRRRDYGAFQWIVSIIDTEGKSRLPQSFQRDYAMETPMVSNDYYKAKYLERSFILSKADEFLPEGVLNLLCDIYSDSNTNDPKKSSKVLENSSGDMENSSEDESGSPKNYSPKSSLSDQVPQHTIAYTSIKKAQGKNQNGPLKPDWDQNCMVYDTTSQVLTLPQFHESRRRFGVHGIPPIRPPLSPQATDDILEHIWMFDVFDSPSYRFLLSFDEQHDSLGTRLLKASAVIRRMVRTEMQEKRERCIDLPIVEGQTFLDVLSYLANGISYFPLQRDNVLNLYAFSDFYEMKELQRICAENIAESSDFPTELDEAERIALQYSDEYLLNLLESHWPYYENLEEPLFKLEDIPYYDCYL